MTCQILYSLKKKYYVHPVFIMGVTLYKKSCFLFHVSQFEVLHALQQVVGQSNHVIMILSYFPASAPLFRLRISVAHIS